MFANFRREVEKIVGKKYASLIEEPPRNINADLALPCFSLSKRPSEKAKELAKNFAQSMDKTSLVGGVSSSGPYVNFNICSVVLMPLVLKEVLRKKNKYGAGKKKKEKILIESPGPNTNKPLHLGHIRNMVLGNSIANVLDFLGFKTFKVDIINDRGVHICKSMLAYKKFGRGKRPDKKPDHFVGDFYILFSKELAGKPETEEEIRQMLVDWEAGDKKTVALWKKMNSWALSGFKQTYKKMGVHIDKPYYESDHYLRGKALVLDGLKKNIFSKDPDGNIIADMEKDGPGKRVLLRKDGTTLYITQDVSLAEKRYRDFHMSKMIYVVGVEQVEHFRALFKIFEMLSYPFAKNCYHLAYGMVNLPEGKMKSREGTVVDADNLMDEMIELAKEAIKKHEPNIPKKELESRAEKIGLAAIKFFILKFDALKTMLYDPKKSLSFEGDTGPYLQYTYARARSILRKSRKTPKIGKKYTKKEDEIVKLISKFPVVVEAAARDYKPNHIANYSHELAMLFNEYYHETKIIGSREEEARLALVSAVAQTLRNALALMGIEVMEKM